MLIILSVISRLIDTNRYKDICQEKGVYDEFDIGSGRQNRLCRCFDKLPDYTTRVIVLICQIVAVFNFNLIDYRVRCCINATKAVVDLYVKRTHIM